MKRSPRAQSRTSMLRRHLRLESLEDRRVMATLSAVLDGGALTITDADAVGKNNVLSVSVTGTNLVISDAQEQFISAPPGGTLSNGDRTLSIALDAVASLAINGALGDDLLTVDFSGGNLISAGGLAWHAGEGSDSLQLFGGATASVEHRFISPSDGSIALAGDLAGSVSYTGLEPVVDTLAASARTFTFQGGDESITLTDAPGAAMTIDSTLGESVTFSMPSASLTIDAGSGYDTIAIDGADTDGGPLASWNINGGFADDVVQINHDLAFAAGHGLTIDLSDDAAAGDVDRIEVAAGANVSAAGSGEINLRASGLIGVRTGAELTTVDGPITVFANQQFPMTGEGHAAGIEIDGAALRSTGAGSIDLRGRAGNHSGPDYGIAVLDGTTVQAAAGAVSLIGDNFWQGDLPNAGVYLAGAGITISSANNDVTITAVGHDPASGIRVSESTAVAFGPRVALISDSIDIAAGAALNAGSTGFVLIRPRTSIPVVLGGEFDRSLVLSDAALDAITTGTLRIWGPAPPVWLHEAGVSVIGAITHANNLELHSDGGIRVFEAVSLAVDKNLSLHAVDYIMQHNVNSDLTTLGSGSITLISEGRIAVERDPSIVSENGDILLRADQEGGIHVNHVESTGAGDITLRGRGGRSGVIFSSISSGSGDIRIDGRGVGGEFSHTDTHGVVAGSITTGGSGSVTIEGVGGARASGTEGGSGVELMDDISVVDGDVQITGTGGISTDGYNHGVVTHYSRISATGSGNIRIEGTGGTGRVANGGIVFFGAVLNAATGDITITGRQGTGSFAHAVRLAADCEIITLAGDIAFVGDSMDVKNDAVVRSGGGHRVSLVPYTPGTALNLGGTDSAGVLGLTDIELDRMRGAILSIGDVNSGPITLNANISRPTGTNVTQLTSGNDINFLSGTLTTLGGIFLAPGAEGSVRVGVSGADVSMASGALTFGPGSAATLAIQGAAVDTEYQQLNVVGGVNLTGVDLALEGSYAPAPSDSFILVNNDLTDAIVGTFNGLPEGAVVNVNGVRMRITYVGGTGNDVELVNAAPVVSFTSDPSDPTHGITISFGDAVTGFELSDLVVTNGVAGNFQVIDAATYRFDVTPDATGTLTISVPAGAAIDASGNDNLAGQIAIEVTTLGPRVTRNVPMTILEGGRRVLSSQELLAADPNTLADQVTFTVTATSGGQVELTSAPGVAITSFTQDDINNQRVAFRHDGSESASASFTFTVSDGAETTTAETFSFTVTAVNDAPVLTLEGTFTYTEGDPPLPFAEAATLSDVDSPNFGGGGLSGFVSANFTSGDRLTFSNQGNGLGEILVIGSRVQYEGTQIGTVQNMQSSGFYISLSADATPTAVQALIRRLRFESSSDNPGSATRTIALELNDGDGAWSNRATVTVAVTPVDDVWSASLASQSAYTEDAPPVRFDPSATVADLDSADFNGGFVDVAILQNHAPEDRLSIRHEGNAAGQIGVAGDSVTFGGVSIGTFEVTAASLRVSFNENVTIAAVQALLRQLQYRALGDNPSNATRGLSIEIADGVGNSQTLAHSIAVTAVNDGAVFTFPDTPVYVENSPPFFVSPSAVVSDPDTASYSSLKISTSSHNPTNILRIEHEGNGPGEVGYHPNGNNTAGTIRYGNVVVGTFSRNYWEITIQFTNPVGPEVVQAIVRRVTWEMLEDAPPTLAGVGFQVIDAGTYTYGQQLITIEPLNDSPRLFIYGGRIHYREGDPAKLMIAANVDDPDWMSSGNGIYNFRAEITGNAQAGDELTLVPHPANSHVQIIGNRLLVDDTDVGSFSGGTNGAPLIITLNYGLTPYDESDVYESIAFRSTSDNPTNLTRSISLAVFDPEGASSEVKQATVTVSPLNDAPALGSFGGNLTYRENAAPRPIAGTATVADPDSANFEGGELKVSLAGARPEDRLAIRAAGNLSVSGNLVKFGEQTMGTWSGGEGTTPLVIALTSYANANRVQVLLRSITYANVSENPLTNPRTVRVQLTDGDGGISAPVTKTINVISVNDAPVLTPAEGGTVGYQQNRAPIALLSDATLTDPDSPNFEGGRLLVRIISGGNASNRLLIGGAFELDGDVVKRRSDGLVIGTRNANGGVGTTRLEITFNADATRAIVQQLVRSIRFRTENGTSTVQRTIEFSLTDGDGGVSNRVTKTVNVS